MFINQTSDATDGPHSHSNNNGNGGGGGGALLTVMPLNVEQQISRNNSFNANLGLQDSYLQERNPSTRSVSQPESPIKLENNEGAAATATINQSSTEHGTGPASAPTTLAKRSPDVKTGEVYV